MYYKQKGIPGLAWHVLSPGQTALYVFDDPLKAHKLLLHAGVSILTHKRYPASTTARQEFSFASMKKDITSLANDLGVGLGNAISPYGIPYGIFPGLGSTNDTGTVVVMFDEIGFNEVIPVVGSQGKLTCHVQSIGTTKSLVISPEPNSLIRELTYSTELMGKQLLCLRELFDGLQALQVQDPAFIVPEIRMEAEHLVAKAEGEVS
jgi:hypothetical protein